jgi:hypothetical protein
VARQPIYAALGVPEIWRYDGRRLIVLLASPGRTYIESAQSVRFPPSPWTVLIASCSSGWRNGNTPRCRRYASG